MWAFAQQGSYKMKLREVYKDYGRFKSQAQKLKEWILVNFSKEKVFSDMKNAIIDDEAKNYLEWVNSLEELEVA